MSTRRVGRPVGSKSGVSIKQISDACKDLTNDQRQKVLDFINILTSSGNDHTPEIPEIIINLSESPSIPITEPEIEPESLHSSPESLHSSPEIIPKQPTLMPKPLKSSLKSSKKRENLTKSSDVFVKFSDWEGCQDVQDVPENDGLGFETYAIMKSFAKNTITDEELDEISELIEFVSTASDKMKNKLHTIKNRA